MTGVKVGLPVHPGSQPGLDFASDPDNPPACRGMPTAAFYPEVGQAKVTERAKAVCGECPLVGPCLEYALSRPNIDQHGVWGGMSAPERIAERRKRGLS